jgi:hypothetical protein
MDLDILVLQVTFFSTDAYLEDFFVVVILQAALLPTTLRVTTVTGTAEVKNVTTSPYIFMVRHLIKHGDNFMFSGTADKMSSLFPLYAYMSRNEKMDENGAR